MLTKIKNLFKNMNDEKEVAEEIKVTESSVPENSSDEKENVNTAVTENNSDSPKAETVSKHSPEEIKEEVLKVLKTCYDPEIPVDVWELGLIYDIAVATNGDVLIVMTLTSPSCPVAGILPGEIEQKVKEHPMVNDCKVQLTFEPPWSQTMMSEVAKLELGFM